MAGDWIKLEHATVDKPEMIQMASILGVEDHDLIVGKCLRLWIWADAQCSDGNAVSVTKAFLDRVTGCAGFAEAMLQVGWLEQHDGKFSIPDFAAHNGNTAKKRAQTLKRVRAKRNGNARSVTDELPEYRDREEKNTLSPTQETVPEELAEDWDRWQRFRESADGRRVDPIRAEQMLSRLVSAGVDKAKRDIAFSIEKGAKSLLDSDNDYEANPARAKQEGIAGYRQAADARRAKSFEEGLLQ